jgi:hypothetical protein
MGNYLKHIIMKNKWSWSILLLFTGFMLITLTANMVGQSSEDERLFSMRVNQVTFFSKGNSPDYSQTAFLATPFDKGDFIEENLDLESWMAIPFEGGVFKEELEIESWMKGPFLIEKELEFEEWMTGNWMLASFQSLQDE